MAVVLLRSRMRSARDDFYWRKAKQMMGNDPDYPPAPEQLATIAMRVSDIKALHDEIERLRVQVIEAREALGRHP